MDHSGDNGTPPIEGHKTTRNPFHLRSRLAPQRLFSPDGYFRERRNVLRETDTRVTSPSPDTVIQATVLLFLPTDHSGDNGTHPSKDRNSHHLAPGGSFRGKQIVLRETDTCATTSSPEKVRQSTTLPSPPEDHSRDDRFPLSKYRATRISSLTDGVG